MPTGGRRDDPTEQLPGALIAGRYAIERELGRGGMAAVYLAQDLKHGRPVALKFLNQPRADATTVERFVREIETLARLSHPHILPLYDSGEADGLLYFVMPYVPGESLRARLDREGRLEIPAATRLAAEVADALAFAHGHGVIHRDIKPENLLLADGHVLVADFGIAGVIQMGSAGRLTESGTFVGTPAYMSPEQASGDAIDGRSDVYSLGCVLYEAIAGAPPHPPRVARALPVQRLVGPPTPLRQRRRDVPVALDRAVMRAIQALPADRFATAADFAQALEAAGARTTGGGQRGFRRFPALSAAAMAILALGGAVGGLYLAHRRARASVSPALDSSRYVVFPFLHRGGTAPQLLAGDNCQRLLGDALARWQGVTQVSDLVLHEGLSPRDTTLRAALQIAARHHAGQLIWGQVASDAGPRVLVRGTLYDVATGEPNASATVAIAQDLSDAAVQFIVLADSLVERGLQATRADPEGADTRSVPALQAYVDGYRALSMWDLARAETQFRAATRIDPTFAQAQLWLAQTMAWAYSPLPLGWAGIATRSAALRNGLGPRDRQLAQALGALADGRYADACAHYAALVRADSLDFIAWYGLGECQSWDHLVVADVQSSSRWRYRTSLNAAIEAYLHALRIIPSFQEAFVSFGSTRLSQLLFTEPGNYRSGYALGSQGDSLRFAAFPALDHDTLAFVPHPLGDLLELRPETQPPSQARAISRNVGLLHDVTAQWVRATPANSTAHLQLARVLESMGVLESMDPRDTSALTEVRRARALAVARDDRLIALTDQVRFDLKLFRFRAARALADTVAKTWTSPTVGEARKLAALASLTGRIADALRAARLAASVDTLWTPAGNFLAPLQVAEAAAAFSVYAAFGAPIDSARAAGQRTAHLARTWVDPAHRTLVLQGELDRSAEIAFPELGPAFVHREHMRGDGMSQIQWSVAHRDTIGVRSQLAAAEQPAVLFEGGTPDVRGLYEVVRVGLVIGDTTIAIRVADALLPALPRFGRDMTDDVGQPAALVRTMALRAELADRARDHDTARRWAQAVVDLWSGADPPLQPLVARMRTLASS